MRAVYLTGPTIYLRAMIAADAAHAAAWFDSTFPITVERAEAWLKEENQDPWAPNRHLIIARGMDDTVIGGARLSTDGRRGALFFHMAPWLPDADALQAEALAVLDR